VEHRLDHTAAQRPAIKPGQKIALVKQIDIPAVRQVGQFGRVIRLVDHQDVLAPPVVECPDDVTADKPGPAGDDNH
jgi:hypothetical protein